MCLIRPKFTEALAARLAEGAAINLVSPHGQGRRRTLVDLRRCLPDSMLVLQTNIREHPHRLASLLADLGTQAGLTDVARFDGLLDALQQRSTPTLIILHNLDELEAGAASGYDGDFFAALNGIHGRTGLSLLCVSERVPAAWPLDLETVMLPPLTEAQILAELERRNPPVAASAWPGIARWMAAQSAPYTLLDRAETWPSA